MSDTVGRIPFHSDQIHHNGTQTAVEKENPFALAKPLCPCYYIFSKITEEILWQR